MTPLQAVRKKCLLCMAGSAREVEACHLEDCPLWIFRFGNKRQNTNGERALKSIKKYCFECSVFDWAEVKNCNIADCPLFKFRMGKNPNRSGIGNKKMKQVKVFGT